MRIKKRGEAGLAKYGVLLCCILGRADPQNTECPPGRTLCNATSDRAYTLIPQGTKSRRPSSRYLNVNDLEGKATERFQRVHGASTHTLWPLSPSQHPPLPPPPAATHAVKRARAGAGGAGRPPARGRQRRLGPTLPNRAFPNNLPRVGAFGLWQMAVRSLPEGAAGWPGAKGIPYCH